MINRYAALLGGLAVLLGAYGVWWHKEADRLEAEFPLALEKSLPPGAALGRKVAGVDGFPFRFNVRLADVKVSWGEGEWIETSSITGIFQPFTGDHLILHLDAPIRFAIAGAAGTVTAERGLASLVGYESGQYQLDGDSLDVTLTQPAVAELKAARVGFHVRRETIGPQAKYAFAVSAKGITPEEAATGHLAAILDRYGQVGKDGTVTLDIDEKDDIAHARGRTLTPEDTRELEQEFETP
ncbi:MAG: DUF2125 domain-containing protein [Sphingomonadales bacterium]